VVHSRTPALVRSLQPVNRYAGTNQLKLAIGLPLRNPEALTNLLQQIYDPASPNYHHFLTPAQFTERFGPAEKDYQAVIAFAKAHGLKVTTTHSNRMLVDVSASVAEVEKAMHVRFQVYQHPTEKRLFHAPDTEPSLDLPVPVLGISGLNDYSQPRPRLQATPLTSATGVSPNTGSGPNGAYLGKDFRAAYAADTPLDGSGQVVGLLQFDGYTASDIAYYESLAGLPSITLSNVLVDGATGLPTGNELEVSLDIEMAVSMATNLSKVVVYMTPNPSPWEDILNRMANDNVAKQLSCSWYEIDGASNAVADQIFQQMALQGQSFFAASGDADAYTGLIPFPCDTPYITVVGGTTLTTSGPGGAWQSETVWNRGSGVGTGGGISTQFPIPSWQTNISLVANQGSTTMRNIPDVALTAENVYVRTDGKDYLVGGTSCATPLWAGFAALANQQAADSALPPLGFINPGLVAIGNGAYYATVFHDIVTGNNTSTSSPDKFHAVPGYDLCTGWGTPHGQMMIDALADPQLLALVITPASGFNFIGPVGGPFAAPAQSFSLTDVGSDSLNWALVNTSLWLNVSSSSGTLTASGPATMVTVSLNSTASNLPVGIYNATVFFTNLDGGIGQSRQFALNIGELPVILAEPTNQTAEAEGAITLSATISSIGPFTCQWQLDGTNLPNNLITTMAGNGGIGFSGDGGQATNASLDNPYGVAVDDTGDLFIADANNNRVREVNSFGTISTVAGIGSAGFSGDGGLAASAGINDPIGVAVDGIGDLFIADADNNRIRKVDTYGTITTVAGNGNADFAGDGSPATNAALSYPYGVAVDGAGNLFIADLGNNRIRKVDTNGIMSTVAGDGTVGYSGDGRLATNAALADPYGVAVDGAGNLFIADLGNNRIRKVDPLGIISTVAGNGIAGYSGDGGLAINAACSTPAGVAVDVAGNLFIADSGNNRIREVGTNGIIFTVVGNGTAGYSDDDGQATNAVLSYPIGVAVDSGGNLFIADSGNDRIRKVTSTEYPTLILDNLSIYDEGNYTIIVSNAWGCTTSSVANLTILSPPVITSQPQSLMATNGGMAAFSVTTLGTAPLSYQWQKNGLELSDGGEFSGSTTTNLMLSAATISDSGEYTVIITNDWGSVTSSVATLAVGFPPAIISQPQSLTITNGSPASFSVTVSGTTPLGCQWQMNGINLTDGGEISGSANTNLVLSAARMGDAGNYTVIITNAWGCVTSTVATLAVVSPPVITQTPASLIVGVGGAANFKVTASGTAPLGYQWRMNRMNLTDGGEISGSGTTNLVLSATALSDAGNYTVIITNAWGSITSRVATLTVVFPPVITSQPQSLTVTNGSSAQFSVTASGVAPLNYQWQKNGMNLGNGGTVSGSAAANLILSGTTTNDAGNYLVIVTNAWGSATSSVAMLTVVSPPVITQQPTNQVVVAGSAASFNVTASGTAPLGYQWQLDSTNLTDGGELSGSDTTNLVLSATTTNDVGSYSVIITNAWGSVTSSVATLTVVFPPVITSQPQSQTVLVGSPAALNVTVSGTAPLNFQWLKNGLPLSNGSELTGLASPNLVFNATTIGDMGSYTIVVTNTWGSVTSSVAILTVISPPVIAQQPTNQVVIVGSPASFNVTAWGTAPLEYQWQVNGTNLTDGGEISGSTTTNLVLSDVSTNDVGSYTVIITNNFGSVTSSVATLTVVFPPAITSQPQNLTVPIGNPAAFNVTVSGTTPLGCQWQKNGMPLTDGGEISGSATTGLVFSGTTIGDAGNYAIVVTNAWGSTTSTVAILTVISAPVIAQQPTNQIVVVGGAASFSVTALGTGPLEYQWQINGTNLTDGGELSGSTTTNLVLSDVTTNDVGNYTVIITNAWGSVTSSVAALTVAFPPVITSQPQSVTVVNDSSTGFSVSVSGTAPLEYQWQKDGVDLANGGELSGSVTTNVLLSITTNIIMSATTNLVLNAATLADAGNYTIIITNAWGSVTSHVATLTVVFPPAITSQPQSLTVTNGGPAGFSVTVSGTAPLGCQWQMDGMNLTDGGEISGSTSTNLVLSATSTNNTGNYTVIVTNAWGSVTSSVVTLAVGFPPVIASQPQSLTVTNSGAASFSVTVSGTAPLGCQWQKNGLDLADGGEISGSATTNLVLSSATISDSGNYTVIITNAWGSITSSVVTLAVGFPPMITSQPQSLTVTNSSPAGFRVAVSGTAPLTYQWQKNGLNLADGGKLSGSATTNLELSATSTNNAGTYAVIVANAWGSVTSSVATLVVLSPPMIEQQPTNQTVAVGSSASFTVTASGVPPVGYQWNFDGTNITGATNTSLVLSNVQPSQQGVYTVLVTNSLGSVLSSNAVLTVTPDHFSWGQIASTRFVNTPFSVTIQAQNATNGIFTNFTGIVHFDSTNGVAVSPSVSSNFVQGAWTGTVLVSRTVTNLVLRANDGFGHLGLANPINVVALPPLTIRISGDTLQFLWPVTYTGFVLEGSGSISPANWTVISASPIQLGNQFLVPLQLPGTNSFYRLRYNGS
jgi:sugar lactone lactonase YvrE